MTMTGRLRARRGAVALRQLRHAYATGDGSEREPLQLALWNHEWQRLRTHIPYFRQLQQERGLPLSFTSWDEFVERLPIMTRATVQSRKRELTSAEKPPDMTRMTGGSTAEPIQIPAWRSEGQWTGPDMWLGRSWYGVSPASRLFMLWGHSHLLGSGLRGWINARKRTLFDRLLGYHRFSAYDLQPRALRRAAHELIAFRPEYMLGYSVALDLFARANADLRDQLRATGLKMVVGTGESFPTAESVALLEELFGCPVAMEYGAVESGLIAHTQPGGGYRVFWRTYFVEAEREQPTAAGHKIRVTSLYPRCFPLVRYEIGDEIEVLNAGSRFLAGITDFKRVIGRCNDYVLLADGAVIHSEVFSHAVRPCPAVTSYQVLQQGREICLQFLAAGAPSADQVSEMRARLTKAHPQLGTIGIKKVDHLQQTIAGKVPMVIRQ